jgi:hypothetical protein
LNAIIFSSNINDGAQTLFQNPPVTGTLTKTLDGVADTTLSGSGVFNSATQVFTNDSPTIYSIN